ncbi:MAG: response regulator [Lachnospiraceae bacterium]|nr:response regulator [Lachnospiraceae bacterium]
MSLSTLENIVMLLAAVIGIFVSVFRYIETPKKGWLYVTGFFLAHFLSDYYWAAYTFVIHDDPDVSAIMAYFGWNIAYALLLLAVLHMRDEGSKRFIHPLMFIPVPVNIGLFILYIQYGGLFNNIWQGTFLTAAAVISLQSLLYYAKNKKNGAHFPYYALNVVIYIIFQYAMWTVSCFDFEEWKDPYYPCAFACYLSMVFFELSIKKNYEAQGVSLNETNVSGMRFRMLLQVATSLIIFGGCIVGIQIASRMKASLSAQEEGDFAQIAVALFFISVVLVILICLIIFVITVRYRSVHQKDEELDSQDGRITFIATILLCLVLMVFSVIYTSRLFYKVSVDERYEMGVNSARLVATEIENYLSATASALMVTADTVDTMLKRDEDQEKILTFLIDQTENYKRLLDENLTGLYGLIRGEYLDGLEWVPPDGYDPKKRSWYNLAVRGGGDAVMVPPYVDAQTGEVVITVCRKLSDYGDKEQYDSSNVVAIDVIVNYIQDVVEETSINGMGTTMVINEDGTIIAHMDRDSVGKDFRKEYSGEIFENLVRTKNGTIRTVMNGEPYTVFAKTVMDQWYALILVRDGELLEEVHLQLALSIAVSFVIFVLISFFYYLGYRNEQFYGRRMEEMRISRNRQEYEARALKLEKQAADEANKAKSSFLADMSHEIRTPINAILGMNEMILRESEDKDILEYSGNIETSGKNLLQLINSILDFSKIEDGKMEIVPVTYSLSSSISYLYNSIIERARSKDLEVNVNVDPELPSKLFGDDTRINQVIMNLLTNAVKYTREGSVTLTVKQEERTTSAVLMSVEVRDTGIGIRKEDMSKLFESFERLDQVKNRNIEGTGLGMSIVTKLLSLMDSTLKVESIYGEGSVFSFEIWQEIRDYSPVGEVDMTASSASEHNKNRGRLYAPDAYILVTDDTKMNIMVVEKLLKRTAVKIDTASSGAEALKLADENAYDLILMDQRMPGMDGTETLKKIRELDSAKNAENPVICLTADAIRGAKERYMAQGFTDYLTKPVEGDALESMLLAYLPKEKIIDRSNDGEQVSDNKNEPPDKTAAALKEAGIDMEAGIGYCHGDKELYRMVLQEYVDSRDNVIKSLQSDFEGYDWQEYRVYVHSVKSTSKTIGAVALSERFAALEAAADNNDEDFIHAEHDELLGLFNKTADDIKKILEEAK